MEGLDPGPALEAHLSRYRTMCYRKNTEKDIIPGDYISQYACFRDVYHTAFTEGTNWVICGNP